MIGGKRKSYGYRLDASQFGARRKPRKPSYFKWLLFLLVLAGGVYLWTGGSIQSEAVLSHLPFPKKLQSIRILHNGQEVALEPNAILVVNPKDTLMALDAATDGWITWGVKLQSPDVPIENLSGAPVVVKTLWPGESFETPKSLELQALWWSRPLGKVALSVELGAQDWLQKALAATNPERKIECLKKVLEKSPGNILAKTQMAGIYYESKQYDEAARLYQEIMETGETQPLLERLLAVHQKQDRVDDALSVYVNLLQMSKDPQEFQKFLQYLDKHKSNAEAEKFLRERRKDFPVSFQSAIDLFLANLYTQMKDWSRAALSYEKAVKSGVKDPDILYNIAASYQQSDNTDQAIQALERYLKASPQDMRSWMQLGALQEKKGDLQDARETYETVLAKNSKNEDAIVRLVALLEKTKDKQGLESTYEKLTQMQPKNKVAHFNLAMLYYDAQKWEKAASEFKDVIDLDSKDIESRKHLLDIYRKTKNSAAEVETLQGLVQLDNDNLDYYKALFAIYDDKKDYKSMASMLQKGVEQNPDSVQLHQYLLYALLKVDDKKNAVKELEQLIRLQPKEKEHLLRAANLYESLGQITEAQKMLERYLKLDPKNKEAQDNYMRLTKKLMENKKSH
jgi:tetratricopeptide (TPR) repeat protein